MAKTLNLDEVKASRAEAAENKETPKVVFGGETFELPFELPFGVFLRLGEIGEENEESLKVMREMVDSIFLDQSEKFLSLGPSLDDIFALMTMLMEAYEIDPKLLESSDSA